MSNLQCWSEHDHRLFWFDPIRPVSTLILNGGHGGDPSRIFSSCIPTRFINSGTSRERISYRLLSSEIHLISTPPKLYQVGPPICTPLKNHLPSNVEM